MRRSKKHLESTNSKPVPRRERSEGVRLFGPGLRVPAYIGQAVYASSALNRGLDAGNKISLPQTPLASKPHVKSTAYSRFLITVLTITANPAVPKLDPNSRAAREAALRAELAEDH